MRLSTHYIVRILLSTVKAALLTLILSSVGFVVSAQNTKGDRSTSNKKQTRETRFKTKSRQGDRAKTKDIAGRRLRTKGKSSESKANASYPRAPYATKSPREGKDRTGKSYRPTYSSSPRASEKSLDGSKPRKRVAVRSASSSASRRNVYPQRGTRSVSSQSSRGNVYSQRNSFSRPKDTQHAWRGSASGSRIRVRSATAQVKRQNVYTKQGGDFKNFRSPVIQRPVSNRSQLAKTKRLGSTPSSPTRKVSVTPRSASRSFIRSKSINPYAGFFRVKRKGEQVTTKDIAGRTLRTRNFQTPAQGIILPKQDPYRGRKRIGDRAYRGPAAGYHKSATVTKPKAWTGDIAGRKIRGLNYESPKRVSNKAINPPKLGKVKVGDHPRHNTLKGTGYRTFSNNSGKVGSPIPVRTPGKNSSKLGAYQNKLTGKRPVKGGGSVSGKGWNNQGQPLSPRAPGIGAKGVQYSGNIKTSKPSKGGGSISGKLWNNNQQPIPVRTPPEEAAKAAKYPGNFKHFELYPSMSNQGEEFTGFIKRGKYSKSSYQHADALLKKNLKNVSAPGGLQVRIKQPGYARNKNAHEDALLKRDPGSNVFNTDGLQIKVPSPGYVQNKNAHEESILKRKPSKQSYLVDNLTVKMKQPGWARNKNAHEDALLKRDPGSAVFAPNKIYGKIKAHTYKSNPSANKEAMKVREPGKAFAKASSYQGNIKMQKFNFLKHPDYHPDASYVKTNKNNVKEERDLLTNIRLFWAKLFRKSENQPDHLKEKIRKPRYDNREVGLWND